MKRIISLFLILFVTSNLMAQTKEMILQKINSGEIKIDQSMMDKASNLNNIEYRSTSKTQNNIVNSNNENIDSVIQEKQSVMDSLDSKNIDSISKEKTLPEEYEFLSESKLADLKLKPFGSSIFKNNSNSTTSYMPSMYGHIMAIGDELIVYTWGRESSTKTILVDKDGFFNYPPLAPMRVAGRSFNRVKKELKTALENISGINARLSLGQMSSISVMVLGDVLNPGAYSVISGTNVLNALYKGNGIKAIGTFRNIKLRRYGKVYKNIDLYKLLINGQSSGNAQLINGDVIFVPVATKKVAVAGFVKRPAIYEARKNERVSDLLYYAGGLNPNANSSRIVVERIKANRERQVINVSYNAKKKRYTNNVKVLDGDLIKVFPLLSGESNSVVVVGNVLSPGKYEYKTGMTLKSILPSIYSFKQETFFDYALVKRAVLPDMHIEYFPISLTDIYFNDASFNLEANDILFIFNKWELVDKKYISIKGNVRKPGGTSYVKNMKVSDLINNAGGLKADTYLKELHILRTSSNEDSSILLKTNLGNILADFNSADNILLEENDKVILFSKWDFVHNDSVSIVGEVKVPGKYLSVNGMTVQDLIKHAGGFTQGTYKLSAEVVRSKIVDGTRDVEEIFKIDISNINSAPFLLQHRDEVFIRRIEDYNKSLSIKLTGEFKYPGVYRVEKGETLSSVIKRAGGCKENAYLPGAVFTRKRVQETQQKHLKTISTKLERQLELLLMEESAKETTEQSYKTMLIKQRQNMLSKLKESIPLGRVVFKMEACKVFDGSEYDVEVEDGDELVVRRNINTVSIMGEVFAPIAIIHSKKTNTVGECLEYSGGITDNGDANNIYLLNADGSVETPKTVAFFYPFSWTEVTPGATIIVPPKVPKKGIWTSIENITRTIYQLAVTAGVVATIVK